MKITSEISFSVWLAIFQMRYAMDGLGGALFLEDVEIGGENIPKVVISDLKYFYHLIGNMQ